MGSERRAKALRRLAKHTYHFRNEGNEAALNHVLGQIEKASPSEAEIRRAVKSLVKSRRIHVEASVQVPAAPMADSVATGDDSGSVSPSGEGVPMVRKGEDNDGAGTAPADAQGE